MVWQRMRRGTIWTVASVIVVFVLLNIAVLGALLYFASQYTRDRPWDLSPYLPKIELFLKGQGINMTIGHIDMYYDGSPVVRARDIFWYGENDELGVVIEQAAVRLANRRFLMMVPAPKEVEANGVTLRLVREKGNRVHMAGMDFSGKTKPVEMTDERGIVEWLNGLGLNLWMGRLTDVRIDNANLLLRDQVQQAEWVLENTRINFNRARKSGEHGSLVGILRRLYGAKDIKPMPTLVTFDHDYNADEAEVNVKFGETDMRLVEDYLPPQMQDFLKAKGRLEMGTSIVAGNRVRQPWVTLRLENVQVMPPAGYSKPITFPKFDITAAYQPSPTDVLTIRNLQALGPRKIPVSLSGTITGITGGDPKVDVIFTSTGGDVQGVFDYFPDIKLKKSLEWLRPNIKDARFTDLVGRYRGKPSDFPDCTTKCGVEVVARVLKGKVKYLPTFGIASSGSEGSFYLGNNVLVVKMAKGGSTTQKASDVVVTLTEMFSPLPTHVLVDGRIKGDLREVVDGLSKLAKKPAPATVEGQHDTQMKLDLALIKGRDVILEDIVLNISSTLSSLKVSNLAELGGETLTAEKADFYINGPNVKVSAYSTVRGRQASVVVAEDFYHAGDNTKIAIDGNVDGGWLWDSAGKPTNWKLEGPLNVKASLVRVSETGLDFEGSADLTSAIVSVTDVNYSKAAGTSLRAEGQGSVRGVSVDGAKASAINIKRLHIDGKDVTVSGMMNYDPRKTDDTVVKLNPFQLGDSDVAVDYRNQIAKISGKRLDISGYDLMADDDKDSSVKNMALDIDVARMDMKKGRLENVKAYLKAEDGKWAVQDLKADVQDGGKVDINTTKLGGGRERLAVAVENLGQLLTVTGIYDKLKGGKISGEINYDTPSVGGGVLTMYDFELNKPPTLVKLLGMLSLTQLLEGVDSIIFRKATIPLRMDKNTVYLDRVLLDGPGMTLRLTGNYFKNTKDVDIAGQLVPALPMNRLLSKIPLLGGLLTGSQDGLVVADFGMKGKLKDPDISVQPLSVLTPGLLKDIFRGITGGGKEPPRPNVIDDRNR